MSTALDPRQRKLEIERQIVKLNKKIDAASASGDSLTRFKGSVEYARDDFSAIVGKTTHILEPLDRIKADNPIAAKYQAGMKQSLSSIGMSVVGAAFTALLGMIAVEKGKYYAKTLQYEGEIRVLQTALKEAETEIAVLEKLGG